MKMTDTRNPALVYLVGFMGAGKTSVGQRLAELLGWSFVDLDQEIEKREGEPIRSIFKTRGESRFREIERRELERVSLLARTVVALGGGTYCREDNRRTVEATGVSVWLDVSVQTIIGRCAGDVSRPLLASQSEMEQLLEIRRPFYEKSSLRIEADTQSVDFLARRILQSLGQAAGLL
jgi:shikimate kinase